MQKKLIGQLRKGPQLNTLKISMNHNTQFQIYHQFHIKIIIFYYEIIIFLKHLMKCRIILIAHFLPMSTFVTVLLKFWFKKKEEIMEKFLVCVGPMSR